MKTDKTCLSSAYTSVLGFNLKQLMRCKIAKISAFLIKIVNFYEIKIHFCLFRKERVSTLYKS